MVFYDSSTKSIRLQQKHSTPCLILQRAYVLDI